MTLFSKIVETGSITSAATQLGLAKSAVSRRLAELEDRLGVQLLNRTTRKSSLTEAGQLFYTQSQKILNDTEDMISAVSLAKSELSGTLRVAAPLSFGLKHLAPVVTQFALDHPALIIDLNFADRQVNLIEDGIDVAVRIATLENSSLIARRLTTIRHNICASPDYLARFGTPTHPDDLHKHRILRYKSPTGLVHRLTDPGGQQYELQGQTAMLSNNGDFLRQAALDGLGLFFGPTFISYENVRNGTLVPLLTDYQLIELGAYAIYPPTRYLSSRVRLFIDHLAESFSDTPEWDLPQD